MSGENESQKMTTGMDQVDTQLNGGFITGSVVLITGKPESLAEQVFLTTTSAHRSYHISFDQIADDERVAVAEGQAMAAKEHSIQAELAPDEADQISAEINELVQTSQLPRRSIVALETTNFAEKYLYEEDYQSLLTYLQEISRSLDVLVVLFGITESVNPPAKRWMTKTQSDYIIELRSQTEDKIEDSFILQKIPARQESKERVLRLKREGRSINVDPSESFAL